MHNQLYNNDSCKAKILNEVVCTSACLCLEIKLAFLRFMNVDPQNSNLVLLERCRNQNLHQNAMHDVKNER
jgi:hypothetical protein